MTTTSKTQAFRESVSSSSGPLLVLDTPNALFARQAEKGGADGCWISSLGISATKGWPDSNVIGFSEMLEAAHSVNTSVRLPVVVDADEGYGTGVTLGRATREFSAIGVAGIVLEDNCFPKINSLLPNRARDLEAPEAFARKIRIAKSAQMNDDFVVIARVEALIAGEGLERALYRGRLYADAGADMILIHSARADGLEAVQVAQQWDLPTPLVSIPTKFPQLSRAVLGSLGYSMVIYANQLLRSSVAAVDSAIEMLTADSASQLEPDLATLQHLFALAGSGSVDA